MSAKVTLAPGSRKIKQKPEGYGQGRGRGVKLGKEYKPVFNANYGYLEDLLSNVAAAPTTKRQKQNKEGGGQQTKDAGPISTHSC